MFDLLTFTHLRRHREIAVEEAANLCQQSAEGARRILDRLRGVGLLEWHGRGEERRWVLSPEAYECLGLAAERARDLDASE